MQFSTVHHNAFLICPPLRYFEPLCDFFSNQSSIVALAGPAAAALSTEAKVESSKASLIAGSPKTIVDVFLVCVAIGGKEAKTMACLQQHRHMKLIPWGGVRCRVLSWSISVIHVLSFSSSVFFIIILEPDQADPRSGNRSAPWQQKCTCRSTYTTRHSSDRNYAPQVAAAVYLLQLKENSKKSLRGSQTPRYGIDWKIRDYRQK